MARFELVCLGSEGWADKSWYLQVSVWVSRQSRALSGITLMEWHPLAMTELLSRHCELCSFPVFRPPFYSCSVCASCSTSVPRMHLSDCSWSLEMCCAGAGLPEGSTNVWGFHLKLSDSLGVHSITC